MGDFVSMAIGVLIGALFSGLIIWIIGKLGLGLEVDGFGPAYLAAVVIGVLNLLILWIFGSTALGASGWLGILVSLVVAALVLYTAGAWIKGIRVKGFVGALVGAVAIAVVAWLVTWLVALVV